MQRFKRTEIVMGVREAWSSWKREERGAERRRKDYPDLWTLLLDNWILIKKGCRLSQELYDPFCKSKQSLWQVAEKRLEGEQN
jgi:hypothetical protein